MTKLFFNLIVIAAVLSGCMKESHIKPVELLCEGKTNPTGIATAEPTFNWKNEANVNKSHQTAYQILVASSAALLEKNDVDLWNTGKVLSSKSVWIPYGGKALESRSVAYWKVKVWDQEDASSNWSDTQQFSVGLLNAEDWKGEYIGMNPDKAEDKSPFFRTTFALDETYDELYLHVNSLGYHEIYVNNQKVGDALLAPAESQFDKRSFSLSYDLAPYLHEGKNAVVLWLGYGWYKHFQGESPQWSAGQSAAGWIEEMGGGKRSLKPMMNGK
jgi:alpha-L-rhamnosidase